MILVAAVGYTILSYAQTRRKNARSLCFHFSVSTLNSITFSITRNTFCLNLLHLMVAYTICDIIKGKINTSSEAAMVLTLHYFGQCRSTCVGAVLITIPLLYAVERQELSHMYKSKVS